MENYDVNKKKRAKRRIEELKGFYVHLVIFVVINLSISINKILRNIQDGETFWDAFWDFGTFAVWIFWGVGLIFHASKTFNYNPFFSKEWEEKQIKKFMEEDRKESEKYR
ncbi:2TM domain-containing protein [Arenibacter latericius]|uniref:2TM domain-containing protein n=1 Tax=Arenibacter latericius TaxID=86104 RepID=UPI0004224566|nr:2TM domain-containing protein [Arenibacter latericius]MDX1364457.1 2TM domain-containing protein [Arenibacter latericius]